MTIICFVWHICFPYMKQSLWFRWIWNVTMQYGNPWWQKLKIKSCNHKIGRSKDDDSLTAITVLVPSYVLLITILFEIIKKSAMFSKSQLFIRNTTTDNTVLTLYYYLMTVEDNVETAVQFYITVTVRDGAAPNTSQSLQIENQRSSRRSKVLPNRDNSIAMPQWPESGHKHSPDGCSILLTGKWNLISYRVIHPRADPTLSHFSWACDVIHVINPAWKEWW